MSNRWAFMAVDRAGTPHLIFTSYRVRSLSDKTSANMKVSCVLEAKVDIPISIEFNNSADANTVYNMIGKLKRQSI